MRFLASVAAAIPIIIRDVIGIAGAAAFTYGAWLIAEPAGYMIGGWFMIGVAILLARRAG